jgi:2-methylcitrate dehydratase PrpD
LSSSLPRSPQNGETQRSLTAHVAEFVTGTSFDDIPAAVLELGKKSILDTFACALCGSIAPVSAIMRRYAGGLGLAGGESVVIGSDERLPPRFAALLNGTAMHADDFDDTYLSSPDKIQGLHATAPVLAAVMAMSEAKRRSGKDLLTACHVGIDVGSRIFDAAAVAHIANGFHSTGTSGMLGAAAGAARLAGLDVERTRDALSLAASQTGTLLCQLGTMAKPFHSGLAAECAVVSVELAALGMTACPTALEARWGFFHAEGGGYDDDRIRGLLGNPWTFVDRGQWIKPWPTGALGHTAYTLMLELVRAHDIRPADVARIGVRTRQSMRDTLFHHRPQSELEAKFSLEFGLATLLHERKITPAHFTDEFVIRSDLQATIAKVEYTTFPDADAKKPGYTGVTSFLVIALNDGRTVSGRLDLPKGSPANPMSYEEVAEKFRDCAALARWPRAKTERAIDLVKRLESIEDVGELAACFVH